MSAERARLGHVWGVLFSALLACATPGCGSAGEGNSGADADGGDGSSCVRDCRGRECGDDGCGGDCGQCPADAPYCNGAYCELNPAPECAVDPNIERFCEGHQVISSRAELINVAGCSEVLGSLTIRGVSGADLGCLAALTRVKFDLEIENNPGLERLDGLEQLSYVGGRLRIANNPALADLSALRSLATVTSELEIVANPSLQSVTGPERLAAGGAVLIADNAGLTSVALPNLTEARGGVSITANPSLAEVRLPSLRTAGSLVLGRDDEVEAVGAIGAFDAPALQRVEGSVRMSGMTGTSVVSLPSLASVEGDLDISANADLASLGLGRLATVGGSLTIEDNAALDAVTGLDRLESVGGDLGFWSNARLESMDFASLTTMEGNVEFTAIPLLRELRFPQLREIGGSLSLRDLGSLERLDAQNLSRVVGDLLIAGHELLSDLEALRNITMSDNYRAVDIDILDNPMLEEFALVNVERVGAFRAERNATLSHLALPRLVEVYVYLVVRDNPHLPECEARAIADALEAGDVHIGGNDANAVCR